MGSIGKVFHRASWCKFISCLHISHLFQSSRALSIINEKGSFCTKMILSSGAPQTRWELYYHFVWEYKSSNTRTFFPIPLMNISWTKLHFHWYSIVPTAPHPTPLITSARTEEHLPSGQGLTRVLKLTASLLLYITSNVIRIQNFILHLHIRTSRSDILTAFRVEFVIIVDDNSGVISGLVCFCWVYSHKS